MAKIVLETTPPLAEVEVSIRRVDHLMRTARAGKRKDAGVNVATLTAARRHLSLANEALQQFEKRMRERKGGGKVEVSEMTSTHDGSQK